MDPQKDITGTRTEFALGDIQRRGGGERLDRGWRHRKKTEGGEGEGKPGV